MTFKFGELIKRGNIDFKQASVKNGLKEKSK